MKKRKTDVLIILLAGLMALTVSAADFGLNFGSVDGTGGDFDDAEGISGLKWIGHDFTAVNSVTKLGDVDVVTVRRLRFKDNGVTKINHGSFMAPNGAVFPGAVIYGTDDTTHEGNVSDLRDKACGALAFRSATPFKCVFTLAAQRNAASVQMNVGGEWRYTDEQQAGFSGGVSSDPLKMSGSLPKAVAFEAEASPAAAGYELVLQMGAFGDESGCGSLVSVNALHVRIEQEDLKP